jgi:hypothetical protein
MKGSRNLGILAGASLLLAAGAFAAGTGKGTLRLYDRIEVQGKQLAPGSYRLQWNGEGSKVELNISNGKETLSVPAEVVSVAEKAHADGYASTKAEDGNTALTEIFFGGKNYEIRLGNSSTGGSAISGTAGSNQ